MISNWFDDAARRAATRDETSRRQLVNDTATRLLSGVPEHTALDGLALRAVMPITRRRGMKWALGAAITVAAAPVVRVGSADALFCGNESAGVCITDEAIIKYVDEAFKAELAGQDFEIFGLLNAALVFYEAAETLDSGDCASPDSKCGVACCTPEQTCCTCSGGFCLFSNSCDSYC